MKKEEKKSCGNVAIFVFMVAVFSLSTVLISASNWILQNFGDVTLDAILFTIKTPLAGVPNETLASVSQSLGLSIAVILIVTGVTFFVWYNFSRKNKTGLKIISLFLPIFCLLASIVFIDHRHGVFTYISSRFNYSTLLDENYVRVASPEINFPERKKNIVFLVLESMENTFNDPEIMGTGLMPRLKKLQIENLTFKTHNQVIGTTWTVGGITSFLMGTPLLLSIGVNSYDQRFKEFMPNAPSILEPLEDNGYSISLVMGIDAGYGGISNLFTTHCKQANIYDKSYFASRYPPLDPDAPMRSWWGFPDKFVYERSKEILSRLAEAGQPFFVLIGTSDTHVKGLSFGDFPQEYQDDRDSFVAADHMAASFLEWLQEQEFYSDTLVVVIGDHLYMSNSIGDIELPKSYTRNVYNLILNSGIPQQESFMKRSFASFDIAPTLLELAGAKLPDGKFGVGVSFRPWWKNIP